MKAVYTWQQKCCRIPSVLVSFRFYSDTLSSSWIKWNIYTTPTDQYVEFPYKASCLCHTQQPTCCCSTSTDWRQCQNQKHKGRSLGSNRSICGLDGVSRVFSTPRLDTVSSRRTQRIVPGYVGISIENWMDIQVIEDNFQLDSPIEVLKRRLPCTSFSRYYSA